MRTTLYFHNQRVLLVNNPLTGESVLIPESNEFLASYGFSATVNGDCYKLVRISGLDGNQGQVDTKVITIGVDDEWRDFHDPALRGDYYEGAVALNGVLHWVHSTSIYAFDVEKEIGQNIPGLSSDIHFSRGALGVLGGQLCFTHVNENEYELQIDLWTMKQYGVAGLWTKDVILRTSIPSPNIYLRAIPVTTRRNGDILLSLVNKEGSQILISLDPKTKNYVNLVFSDDDQYASLQEYASCFSSLSGMIPRQIKRWVTFKNS